MSDSETQKNNTSSQQSGNNGTGNQPKKKITGTQILLILVLIALVVIGVILWQVLHKPEPVPESGSVVVDETNLNTIQDDMQAKVDRGMYEVAMTMDWSFPNGTSASPDAYVENAASNNQPVNIEVTLEDSGELIYESGAIPIGKTLDRITLDKPLKAGKYNAICTYNMLDSNKQKTTNTLSVAITITVQN